MLRMFREKTSSDRTPIQDTTYNINCENITTTERSPI